MANKCVSSILRSKYYLILHHKLSAGEYDKRHGCMSHKPLFDPLLVSLFSFPSLFFSVFSPLAPLTARIMIDVYVSDHVLKMQKGLKCISYSLPFAPGTSALLSASVFTPFPLNTFSPLYLLSPQVLASHFLCSTLFFFSPPLLPTPLPSHTLPPITSFSTSSPSGSHIFCPLLTFIVTPFLPHPSSSLLLLTRLLSCLSSYLLPHPPPSNPTEVAAHSETFSFIIKQLAQWNVALKLVISNTKSFLSISGIIKLVELSVYTVAYCVCVCVCEVCLYTLSFDLKQ